MDEDTDFQTHELAGISEMAPGTTVFFDPELGAGNYIAACFFTDESGSHAALGMWEQFKVC